MQQLNRSIQLHSHLNPTTCLDIHY